jgi:hypothetical protein
LARQARIFRLDLRKNLRPLTHHFQLDRALELIYFLKQKMQSRS